MNLIDKIKELTFDEASEQEGLLEQVYVALLEIWRACRDLWDAKITLADFKRQVKEALVYTRENQDAYADTLSNLKYEAEKIQGDIQNAIDDLRTLHGKLDNEGEDDIDAELDNVRGVINELDNIDIESSVDDLITAYEEAGFDTP